MSNIIRDAIALRRKHLLLDVLLENDFNDDVIFADALTFAMGGLHTTGYGTFLYFVNHFAGTNTIISTSLVELIAWLPTVDRSSYSSLFIAAWRQRTTCIF